MTICHYPKRLFIHQKTTGTFQKVIGFTNGTENLSNLKANLFTTSDDFDYYKTSLFFRTTGAKKKVYLSGIGFDDSDAANPISTAMALATNAIRSRSARQTTKRAVRSIQKIKTATAFSTRKITAPTSQIPNKKIPMATASAMRATLAPTKPVSLLSMVVRSMHRRSKSYAIRWSKVKSKTAPPSRRRVSSSATA